MLEAPTDVRVYCAYDGSVNAHWVARYAIHLASSTLSRTLRLIHVRDHHLSGALLERKLEHVLGDCALAGVEAAVHEVQSSRSVADAVREALPSSAGTLLLCGTRARARRRRILSGTVSESLLRGAPCDVLVLRVVLPALLGAPRRVLVPVAAGPGEGRAAAVVLRLLLPSLEELHLLRVVAMPHAAARSASREALAQLRARGRATLSQVEEELRADLSLGSTHVDAYVRIAEDWVAPSLVTAGQHKCGLILVRASPGVLDGSAAELRRVERLLAATPCDVAILRTAR